ncbi:MAG: methyltransferase domain-containing protein [Actinomycetota bacterium]
MTRYTYGDSELAGDRLGLVARLFRPTSATFLLAAAPRDPGLALDLGCGPGHTTTLVHETCRPGRTIGVDRSEAFTLRARRHAAPGLGFVAANVATTFLPLAEADLIFARLLLAHLPEPFAVVGRWSTTLTIGGRLLVDDLESIETEDPVFRTYLDDVALAVIRAQGGALFVGPDLHEASDPADLTRVHDAVASFTPAPAETARVFGMNLAVLTDRGEIPMQPALATALHAIATGQRDAESVRWCVRQIAWQRTG